MPRNTVFSFKGAAIAMMLSLGAMAPANAALLIGTIEGNDCAGKFGESFEECYSPAVPGTDIGRSPIIIKFDFNNDGSVKSIEINPLFDSIDGNEFTFSFGAGGTGTGSWTYTPGDGDPVITTFVAKGGPAFNFYSAEGATADVPYSTPINPANEKPYGLSHLSFYDTDGDLPLPEPASLALLGLGLLGIVVARRRTRG